MMFDDRDVLVGIKCVSCGFVDYVTRNEWDHAGVWAFKWWNGTDEQDEFGKDKPCLCPRCHKDVGWPPKTCDAFGMMVVRDEETT